ncbi:hypothetical protein OZN62_06050 [Aurantiacibacter sp. MUD11]|uniref:hypothetical protein n=1 Tax=Aurantiacibacter sp. MUD11 TaxID=3003265 RepID=UPI0022AA5658|nr:hypothetical protein [Aurantiacibacter sp. MUD11]WAT19126.1 hypothetical protein OZN62_06050 [Aurantiacibacter sp. MUD11]
MDDREAAEAQAKQRFFLINAMRIAGVVMILLGILVFNGVMPLPEWAGWVLLVLGMIETFVTPQILARIWSTNERR